MKFKIPFKTPTINLMYSTFRGHRVKSKEARELSKDVILIVNSTPYEKIEGELEVTINIYSNWFNKDGTIKKRDIANLEKFITDSIFSGLEDMDDKQIFQIRMEKFQSDEEFSIIEIKRRCQKENTTE